MLNNAAGKQGARWLRRGVLADTHTHQAHLAQQIFPPDFPTPKVTAKYSPGTTCSMLQAGILQLTHMLWIISFIFRDINCCIFLITADEIPLPKRAKLCTRVFFPRNVLHISRNIKPKYFRIAPPWRKVFQ